MYNFDLVSLFIYLAIGLLCCFWIKQSSKNLCYIDGCLNRKNRNNKYYVFFIAILVVLATIRSINVGTDTVTYELMFHNVSGEDLARTERLFVWFTKFIRLFTDNFRIYLFIVYLIIGLSYVIFIKTYISENVLFAPFILIVFPFLNSLNTMRSSLAITIFLLGLSLFKKRKILGYIVIIASMFFHRMLVAFVFLPIFQILFYKFIKNKNGFSLFVFIAILSIIIFTVVNLLKNIVIKYGLLSGNDLGYLQIQSREGFIKGNYVTLFPYVLLMIFLCAFGKRLEKSKNVSAVKVFCVYDIAVIIPALMIGLWRTNEVLYIGRLIMWGTVLDSILKSFKGKERIVFKITVFLLFLIWLIFRIVSIYESSGLMPFGLWFV